MFSIKLLHFFKTRKIKKLNRYISLLYFINGVAMPIFRLRAQENIQYKISQRCALVKKHDAIQLKINNERYNQFI